MSRTQNLTRVKVDFSRKKVTFILIFRFPARFFASVENSNFPQLSHKKCKKKRHLLQPKGRVKLCLTFVKNVKDTIFNTCIRIRSRGGKNC